MSVQFKKKKYVFCFKWTIMSFQYICYEQISSISFIKIGFCVTSVNNMAAANQKL